VADAFADQLKADIRLVARRVFTEGQRKIQDEFRTSRTGSMPRGTANGRAGVIPRDTGDLQLSLKATSMSLTTDIMKVDVAVTASRNGFDYPEFLEEQPTLGGSRAGSRTRRRLAPTANQHSGWWSGWWTDGGAGDRWERVLQAEFDRIG
jgi:hypothetical protein